MPKLLLFVGLLLMFGCHDPEKEYSMPNKKDINEVVKAVITQGKIFRDTLPLSIDLYRRGGPRKDFFAFEIDWLLNNKKPFHFQRADSAYFIYQIHHLHHLLIDTTGLSKIKFTSAKQIGDKKWDERQHFFNNAIMIPVFSLDQKQAYILMDSYYNIMAGEGYSFTLRKVNGKWYIVHEELAWQS
ncbi:hypothetical protein [Mucilaginibacter sp. dw_454]|uniref:hypothetical protein n=1 Tax=Mucilaginibacter sp. dw_454 TaxID=2720079 RepID=UPI001BD3DEE8|nr:hypothetical protein [Mucilaginibacter sp. dw_454]